MRLRKVSFQLPRDFTYTRLACAGSDDGRALSDGCAAQKQETRYDRDTLCLSNRLPHQLRQGKPQCCRFVHKEQGTKPQAEPPGQHREGP